MPQKLAKKKPFLCCECKIPGTSIAQTRSFCWTSWVLSPSPSTDGRQRRSTKLMFLSLSYVYQSTTCSMAELGQNRQRLFDQTNVSGKKISSKSRRNKSIATMAVSKNGWIGSSDTVINLRSEQLKDDLRTRLAERLTAHRNVNIASFEDLFLGSFRLYTSELLYVLMRFRSRRCRQSTTLTSHIFCFVYECFWPHFT